MRLMNRRRKRLNPNLITSPKCTAAVPASMPLHRDLVIQSVLDPHVRSIELLPACHDRPGHAPRLILHRDDGCFMVTIADTADGADLEGLPPQPQVFGSRGLPTIRMTPDQIRREPRCGNARMIWSFRRDEPTMRQRERILGYLEERGPRPMGELEIFATSIDVLPAVCALACRDIVEVDLDGRALGPRTLVKVRR